MRLSYAEVQCFHSFLSSPSFWSSSISACLAGSGPRGWREASRASWEQFNQREQRLQFEWKMMNKSSLFAHIVNLMLITHHTCGSPELGPDCLDLTWRKQEARTPRVRKLHSEGVRDLSSVLTKWLLIKCSNVGLTWLDKAKRRKYLLSSNGLFVLLSLNNRSKRRMTSSNKIFLPPVFEATFRVYRQSVN